MRSIPSAAPSRSSSALAITRRAGHAAPAPDHWHRAAKPRSSRASFTMSSDRTSRPCRPAGRPSQALTSSRPAGVTSHSWRTGPVREGSDPTSRIRPSAVSTAPPTPSTTAAAPQDHASPQATTAARRSPEPRPGHAAGSAGPGPRFDGAALTPDRSRRSVPLPLHGGRRISILAGRESRISWPTMLGTGWVEVVALAAAFAIAILATPAGISGAVLLLPFQVGVLGTPSPAVTPTNLLYNVVATPGALYRYWRQGQAGGRLALVLIVGTLPGVIAGSIIRVELLPSAHVFDFVVAAVLLPLGVWLALTTPASAEGQARPARRIPLPVLVLLAAGSGGLRGRDLRDRRRFDPGPHPDRDRTTAERGRARRAGLHVRDLGGRRGDLHDPVDSSPRAGRSRLAHRTRARHRRPGGRLYPAPGSSGAFPTCSSGG